MIAPSSLGRGGEQLPPLALERLKDARRSYAPSAGLGRDGLNPRTLLQLGDEALERFLDILVSFEERPSTFEASLTQIIFISEERGGARPIGPLALFPGAWPEDAPRLFRGMGSGPQWRLLLGLLEAQGLRQRGVRAQPRGRGCERERA